MGEKARKKIKERMDLNRRKVEDLKGRGIDTARLDQILSKIEKAFSSGTVPEFKIMEAVSKLEGLLDPKDGPENTGDVANDPKGPFPESAKGANSVRIEPPSEGEIPPPGGEDVNFPDDVSIEDANEEIVRLSNEAKRLGGDLSPIYHHLEALKEALRSKNLQMYIGYHGVVKQWLADYLVPLKKAYLEGRAASLASSFDEFKTWGKQELIAPQEEELSLLVPLIGKATDDLDMISRDMEDLYGQVEAAREMLFSEVNERLGSMMEELEGLMKNKKVTRATVEAGGKALNAARELLDRKEMRSAHDVLSRALIDVKREISREKVDRLSKLLGLLDPVIAKVGDSVGKDSDRFKSLIERRASIEAMPIDGIDEALQLVEKLLDDAARAAAESEEKALRKLEARVKEMDATLGSMDGPDSTAVVRILSKVKESCMEGDLQAGAKLMERAQVAYDNLMARKDRAILEARVKAMAISIADFKRKGHDTSMLESRSTEVQEALMKNELDEARSAIAIIDEGLEMLEVSEAKIEYQRLYIELSNEIKALKQSGADATRYEEMMQQASSMFQEKDAIGSVTLMRNALSEVRYSKTMAVLEKRIQELEVKVREASSLGLDLAEVSALTLQARGQMARGEVEVALETVSRTQSMLEAMVRERDLRRMEKEIETIVMELKRLNVGVEDPRTKIANAYALLEEDRMDKAMELLGSFKSDLEQRLKVRTIETLMDSMAPMMREARILNIEISRFKAGLTKARVRFDAGDLDGALKDLRTNSQELGSLIEDRRSDRAKLDQIRGTLLALEAKVQRLGSRGLDTAELSASIRNVKQSIEAGDLARSREQTEELDAAINRAFRDLPVVSISEVRGSQGRVRAEKIAPSTIEPARRPLQDDVQHLDPSEAKRRLQVLLTRIGRAVQMGGQNTQAQSRADLERIKDLIIKRDYTGAYMLALECMKRLDS